VVFEVRLFTGVIEICPRPTFVATVKKILELTKIAIYNSAYNGDIVENLAPNSGRADNLTVSLKCTVDWRLALVTR